MESHYVLVGLGNPGREYALTRHNMGYLVLMALADSLGWKFKEEKAFQAYVAKGTVDKKTVHLLLPTTYMNASGNAVRRYLDFYKIGHDRVCVVCDDVHLPFGNMRFRSLGSDGGHNGLKSIHQALQSQHYGRLRIGIGRDQRPEQTLADYVLEAFTAVEMQALPNILASGVKEIQRLIVETSG